MHDGVFFIAEPDVIVDEEENGQDENNGDLLLMGFVSLTDYCCILICSFALEVLLDGKNAVRLEEGLRGLVIIEIA